MVLEDGIETAKRTTESVIVILCYLIEENRDIDYMKGIVLLQEATQNLNEAVKKMQESLFSLERKKE